MMMIIEKDEEKEGKEKRKVNFPTTDFPRIDPTTCICSLVCQAGILVKSGILAFLSFF